MPSLSIVFALLIMLYAPVACAAEDDYAIGADVSFLADAEARGIEFKENGVAKPGLEIFRDHGYNWVRLRLFHSPDRLPNDLSYTIALARQAKVMGFKFLLDYHYSDTWADPAKQFTPQAWEDLSHEELVEAVHNYTRDTIIAFRGAGAMPDMVQIGNEVIGGMLWPDGKLPKRWKEFADLLQAGIRGMDAGIGDAPRPKVMIHIDRGGDLEATKSFYSHCREHGVEFDVIGQSYYPWWHGDLEALRNNLAFMANEYPQDIMLVEVAYNWRPAEYRDQPGPFPETPEGQAEFLRQVDRIVRETPHGKGKGIFWWEPAVSPGPIASRGMFDDEGNALPVVEVFDRGVAEPQGAASTSILDRENFDSPQ
jgi:arabinogalactan endo-1,4-beta-galactosidase